MVATLHLLGNEGSNIIVTAHCKNILIHCGFVTDRFSYKNKVRKWLATGVSVCAETHPL